MKGCNWVIFVLSTNSMISGEGGMIATNNKNFERNIV